MYSFEVLRKSNTFPVVIPRTYTTRYSNLTSLIRWENTMDQTSAFSELEAVISKLRLALYSEDYDRETIRDLVDRTQEITGFIPKVPVSFFIVGPDELIKYANPYMGDLFETSPESLTGLAFLDLFPDSEVGREKGRSLFEAAMTGKEILREQIQGQRSGGETFWFYLSALPCRDGSGNIIECRFVATRPPTTTLGGPDGSLDGASQADQLFQENLHYMRKREGWSQEQLAHKCGYDRTYIGKLERGDSHPSLDTITCLALALGVPAQDFFVKRPNRAESDGE